MLDQLYELKYNCIYSPIGKMMIHTLQYKDVKIGWTVTPDGEDGMKVEVNPNFKQIDIDTLDAIELFLSMEVKPPFIYDVMDRITTTIKVTEEAKNYK